MQNGKTQNGKTTGIAITIDPEKAKGQFANVAMIAHSPSEFVVDFVTHFPGMQQGEVVSRVILTPEHAKRFVKAMSNNVKKYESTHGVIKEIEDTVIPMSYRGGQA